MNSQGHQGRRFLFDQCLTFPPVVIDCIRTFRRTLPARRSKMPCAIRALLVCLWFATLVSAQFSGAIQGTVVDSTQAAVPDAVVTATQVETGTARVVRTSGEGFYRISNLAPGTYKVRVEKPGFSVSILDG